MAGLDALLGIKEEEPKAAASASQASTSTTSTDPASRTTPGASSSSSAASNGAKKAVGGSAEMEDHIQKIIDKVRRGEGAGGLVGIGSECGAVFLLECE